MKRIPFLFLVLLAVGCSSATVDYDHALVELEVEGEGPVGIAVRDARGVALVNPSWVGVARKTMGIPTQVHTRSGQPFAAELAGALGACLDQSGIEPYVVTIPPGMERDDALHLLRSNGAFERWVLLDVFRWQSDGYFGELCLTYRLQLEVGAGGPESSRVELEGEKVADYTQPGGYGGACLRLTGEITSELFADVSLAAPKAAAPEPEDAAEGKCSDCQATLDDAWQVCPYCAKPR